MPNNTVSTETRTLRALRKSAPAIVLALLMSSGFVPSFAQKKDDVTLTGYPKARWKSLTSYIDKPAFGDITGDGIPEIIGTTVFGDVLCVDGSTGKVLWTYDDDRSFDVAIYICPAIVDVNCDGIVDVISVTPKGLVLCLDGRSGRRIWSFQADSPVISSPSVFDLKRRGAPETAFTDLSGSLYLLDRYGKVIWKTPEGAPFCGMPAMGVLDGQPVILLSDRMGVLRSYNGTDGTLLWKLVPARGPISTSPMIFRDDSDPAHPWKALIGTDLGGLILLDPKSGSVLWNQRIGEAEAIGDFALGDLDGDGRPECVFSTSASRVIAIASDNGKLIWSRKLKIPFKLNPTVGDLKRIRNDILTGEPVLADVDGDGRLDIILDIRGLNSYVYALRGNDGKVLWSHGNRNLLINPALKEAAIVGGRPDANPATLFSSSVPIFSQPTPVVADFDGDGHSDLIINDRDEVGLISLPLAVPIARGNWAKYAGNACNNSAGFSLPCLGESPPPQLTLTLDPPRIFEGDKARLCWKSTATNQVEINQGIGLVSAEDCRELSVAQTTTWRALAHGCNGEASREITLVVQAKPPEPTP